MKRNSGELRYIKIRFNTKYQETEGALYKWRVLIDGEEHLATSVKILVPSESSEDLLTSGEVKYHLSCYGTPQWKDGSVTII